MKKIVIMVGISLMACVSPFQGAERIDSTGLVPDAVIWDYIHNEAAAYVYRVVQESEILKQKAQAELYSLKHSMDKVASSRAGSASQSSVRDIPVEAIARYGINARNAHQSDQLLTKLLYHEIQQQFSATRPSSSQSATQQATPMAVEDCVTAGGATRSSVQSATTDQEGVRKFLETLREQTDSHRESSKATGAGTDE